MIIRKAEEGMRRQLKANQKVKKGMIEQLMAIQGKRGRKGKMAEEGN